MVANQSVPPARPTHPVPFAGDLQDTLKRLTTLGTPAVARSKVGAVVARSAARSAVASAVVRASELSKWPEGGQVVPTPFEFAQLLKQLGQPAMARTRIGAVVSRFTARRRVAAAVARAAEEGARFLATPNGKRAVTQFELAALMAQLGQPRNARSAVGAVVARSRIRSAVASAVMRATSDGSFP